MKDKKVEPLPYSYTTEGKVARFKVIGTNDEFKVRFQSVEALNRDLPGFINLLFAAINLPTRGVIHPFS